VEGTLKLLLLLLLLLGSDLEVEDLEVGDDETRLGRLGWARDERTTSSKVGVVIRTEPITGPLGSFRLG